MYTVGLTPPKASEANDSFGVFGRYLAANQSLFELIV